MNTTEVYKPLPHPFEHYEASDEGNVRNAHTHRVLSFTVGKDGYCRIGLSRGFRRTKVTYVHRLVALAHVAGNLELTVNHKDLNKQNNRADNLEWITLSQNHLHFNALRPEVAQARGRKISKAVVALCLCDGTTERYASGRAAAIHLGAAHRAANICTAAKCGTTAYGRTWSYEAAPS